MVRQSFFASLASEVDEAAIETAASHSSRLGVGIVNDGCTAISQRRQIGLRLKSGAPEIAIRPTRSRASPWHRLPHARFRSLLERRACSQLHQFYRVLP